MIHLSISSCCYFLIFLATIGVVAADPLIDKVRLSISYCPTVFSSMGAVVDVTEDGNFTVINKFKWPNLTPGCDVELDPEVEVDLKTSQSFLDFGDDWGLIVEVDLDQGKIDKIVKPKSSTLFDGFTEFSIINNAKTLIGVTPTVTQDGWCNDGCFAFGTMDVDSGVYQDLQNIPYKAVMTDTHFYDAQNQLYWLQASYPLTANASCSSDQTKQCMIAIDATTGAIKSIREANAFEVYKYFADDTNTTHPLAFVYGFETICKDEYNDFAFARVELATGKATLLGCADKVVLQEDPMIGGFNHDGSQFVHGSGNAETGDVQLLIFDSATGKVLLSSHLTGLKQALGVSKDAPFIDLWSVSF